MRKKCMGRTPGNVLTSYACNRYAQPGKDWCYWHDPETETERMERHRKAAVDRRAERENRERICAARKPQPLTHPQLAALHTANIIIADAIGINILASSSEVCHDRDT